MMVLVMMLRLLERRTRGSFDPMDLGLGSATSVRNAALLRPVYFFDFKMLHGCPALEILRLHMQTEHGHHSRLIRESDLYISGADGGSQERLVAQNLRKFYMNDFWEVEDPVVPALKHREGSDLFIINPSQNSP
ncbi:hypothetical protein EC957_010924 [Mortierella hygrophila]|uniref:Uncharacterized protein n=1 Tax=Mortierella hygrophila TaxID=979708 RepID=A0A9P6K459_9FUNG|nr:hypothetical protein EC957_010924 [Mortierella hygrophila]